MVIKRPKIQTAGIDSCRHVNRILTVRRHDAEERKPFRHDLLHRRNYSLKGVEMDNAVTQQTLTNDQRNMGLLIWIGSIFFGFLPGLILFLVKKDDAYIQEQSKEALNWAITSIFASIICLILTFIVIGAFLFPVLMIVNLVFCIMGAVAASKGDAGFRVPFAVRLIK
jgi:uncharacterized protein